MAFLTNPKAGFEKFTKFLKSYGVFLFVFLYSSGIIYFLTIAYPSLNDATYFSENALLPGLVQGEFKEDITAKKYYSELKDVMQYSQEEIPVDWLIAKFNDLNIDAYVHNFSLEYPLAKNTVYHGENVYAIIQAPRSSSTEGVIVTAPFRTQESAHPDNSASIGLLLALAKFCRKQKYWAKDIIFLITDHEQLGTQAWLEAYHNIQLGSGILKYGNILRRAGSIQAAINLEFHSTSISHVDVKIEGLNGQLPNLDLVNLVHRLCKNEGIRHTFKNRGNPKKKDSVFNKWYHSFVTMMSMVLTQASCVPNGNHGLYHRFGIEAVTLEGYEPPSNNKKQVAGLLQAGKVLEGILRSLNNLLERFHQSYFFYLLPGIDRFIPIGMYMPCIVAIGMPLILKAFTLWLKIFEHKKTKDEKIRPKDGVGDTEEKKSHDREENKSEDTERNKTDGINTKEIEKLEKIRLSNLNVFLIVTHLIGLLFSSTGVELSRVGFNLAFLSAKNSIYIFLFIFFIFSTVFSHFFRLNKKELDILNIFGLLELATFVLILAMHNFSLAFILSSVYVPCVVFINSKPRFGKKLIQSFVMIHIHPFILVHLIVLAYTWFTQGPENILEVAFSATQHSFVYFVMDDMIYGNWFLKAVFGVLIPNWIVFWTTLWC